MKEPNELTRLMNILDQRRPFLVERYHVQSLGLFGSYVRREQRSDSDLDVLVAFTETPSLFEFLSLESYLSDLLGIKVDLVMRDRLKTHIGERILQEVVEL